MSCQIYCHYFSGDFCSQFRNSQQGQFVCAVLCSADTSTSQKEKTGRRVKENEKRMAAEKREQFQSWTQNVKRFQESLESLQRLHTQNPAAGSNVLYAGLCLKVNMPFCTYSFTGSCSKLLL